MPKVVGGVVPSLKHHYTSRSLFLSLSNRIESRRCLLTKKRSSLSSNRRRNGNHHIMAKYYPDIAKGAKGKETLFFFALSSRFITIARRSIGFDLSLCCSNRHTTDHKCNALDTSYNRLTHRQPDVRKQILAGRETDRRRGAHVLFERFSLPTYVYARVPYS